MREGLENSVALVTGSSRGIGASTARELADCGAHVAVNYRQSADAADSVAADVRDRGSEAITVQADVTDPDAVTDMVDTIEAELGTVDVLVNNANLPYEKKPIAELRWAEFEQKLTDELGAAFTVSKAVLPGMVEQEGGRLVYVSSELSRRPQARMSAHGTAKAGLNSFARYVALEYGEYGIAANVVSPALTETDATAEYVDRVREEVSAETPLGRVPQPEDVAKTITAFAADAAQFASGTYTPVNGGLLME
mgnify:CR=1 FL=1